MAPDIKIADLAEIYLQGKIARRKSVEGALQNYVCPSVGHIVVSDFKKQDYNLLDDKMKVGGHRGTGLAKSSKRLPRQCLREVLELGMAHGLMPSFPPNPYHRMLKKKRRNPSARQTPPYVPHAAHAPVPSPAPKINKENIAMLKAMIPLVESGQVSFETFQTFLAKVA